MANHNPPINPFPKGNTIAKNSIGKRHKKTLIFDVLGQERIDALVLRAYEMAMKGDAQIMKALIDKVAPSLKSQDIEISVEKTEFPTVEQLYSPDFKIDDTEQKEPLDSDVIDGDFTECSDE